MADRRGSTRARVAAPFLGSVVALWLAACSTASSPSPLPTEAQAPSASPIVSVAPTETAAPPTAAPTATQGAISGAAPCTAADLKASHGLVEGAAGSRLTSVVLVAGVKCSVDAFPAFGVRDAHGVELVGSAAGGPGRVDLDPDASYQSALRFSNWCGPDPAYPLKLELRIGAEIVVVTGSSFPDQGDMPPCNGGGGPHLEAGGWEAAP